MKKVLIVDDDLYIRELYEELLKDEGYEVTTGSDGAEGLTKMSEGGYDLVLLDVMMPKIDGVGILQKLAETPAKSPNGPIIILTNLANDPVIDEAKKLGAQDSFIKSDHTPDEFLGKVKEYLQ